jgi:DNA repair exonuclease SbcCD ATPase subunit
MVEETEVASIEAADETIAAITEIEDEAEEPLDDDVKEALDDESISDEAEHDEVVAGVEAAETIKSEEDVVPDELEPVEETPAPPVSQPAYVTRGGACGLIFLGGLVTLFLTIIITLGVLSSFNNGRLTFASPYQIAVLETKVENMSAQADILAADIDGLRTRMDNLESLSGQVSDMQVEFDALQEEIVDLQAIVASNQEEYDQLVAEIEVINEDIDALASQDSRFNSFLEGLQTLMESLFSESLEVEETP